MVTLTVTMGVPGSGKSTWAEAQSAWWACTDAERTGDIDHRTFVAALQDEVLQQLRAGVDVVTDGCNVDRRTRRSWLELGRRADARCVLAIVECDADEALRRNASRPHGERVPHQRMLRYLERFPLARTQVGAEGWDAVTYTRPRQAVEGVTRRW